MTDVLLARPLGDRIFQTIVENCDFGDRMKGPCGSPDQVASHVSYSATRNAVHASSLQAVRVFAIPGVTQLERLDLADLAVYDPCMVQLAKLIQTHKSTLKIMSLSQMTFGLRCEYRDGNKHPRWTAFKVRALMRSQVQ